MRRPAPSHIALSCAAVRAKHVDFTHFTVQPTHSLMGELADPAYLREASLSHLTRVSTEARSISSGEWIRGHVKRKHRYRPLPGERCAGSSAGYEKSWRAVSTSFSQAARRRPPTYSVSARPPVTGAGGAARESDRHPTTFSSGAGGGPPRSEDCGGELRGTASGVPPGPPPSASSSETRAQRRQFWTF